jgi:imidazolonepropionase-like amidohydrolase
MGTDMGYDPEMGDGSKELELYVDLGMTPMEAIVSATRNAAEAIKLGSELGTLEAGKLADILLVEGDPSKNVSVLTGRKNIKVVMKEGEIYVDRRPGKSKSAVQAEPRSWKIIDNL